MYLCINCGRKVQNMSGIWGKWMENRLKVSWGFTCRFQVQEPFQEHRNFFMIGLSTGKTRDSTRSKAPGTCLEAGSNCWACRTECININIVYATYLMFQHAIQFEENQKLIQELFLHCVSPCYQVVEVGWSVLTCLKSHFKSKMHQFKR